jgi:hypothetical protein
VTDGGRARWTAMTRKAGILHWGDPHYANEATSKRKRDTRGLGVPGQASTFVRDMGRSDLPLPAKRLAASDMRVPRCLHECYVAVESLATAVHERCIARLPPRLACVKGGFGSRRLDLSLSLLHGDVSVRPIPR